MTTSTAPRCCCAACWSVSRARGEGVDRPASVRAVVVSDGKRGHENQSRVLARMLGDAEPVVLRIRSFGGEPALRLWLAVNGRRGLSQAVAARVVQRCLAPEDTAVFRSLAHEYRESRGSMRLITVSSGTAAASFNLVASRLFNAPAVVNMTPSLLPRRWFDVNVVPEHDLREGAALPPNVLATPLALGYYDEPHARLEAADLCRGQGLDPGGNYLALALGGPSASSPWEDAFVIECIDRLLQDASRSGVRCLATTSRRTPRACAAHLAERYAARSELAYLLDAAVDPVNPLPAFYALAQAVVVSADSFSMVCEAIHAGLHPVVLSTARQEGRGKLARALSKLETSGRITRISRPQDVGNWREGAQRRSPPNESYFSLRVQLLAKLGLDAPS